MAGVEAEAECISAREHLLQRVGLSAKHLTSLGTDVEDLDRLLLPLTSVQSPACRNMDIVGVAGVEAEAECLSAIVHLLQRVGLSAKDIVIRVSSRKVLAALVASFDVPAETFGAVCIVVDKLDKLPADKVRTCCSSGRVGFR